MTRLVPILFLAGCPWIPPSEHNQDDGTDVVSEITLSSIDPAVGPTGLLTDVVLVGTGFEPDEADSYEIFVRGLSVTDLLVTESTISFTMPTQATPGPVDIVLVEYDDDEDTSNEVTLEGGFEYFPNRAQFTGLFGTAENFRYPAGDWPGWQESGGRIWAGFLTPTVAISAVEQYARAAGTCRSSYFVPSLTGVAIDDAEVTLVNTSNEEVVLTRTGTGESSYTSPVDNSVPTSVMTSTFDLLPIEGSTDLPSFALTDVFDMPPELQLDGQSVSIAGGQTWETSFRFSWVHDDDSTDHVVITLDVYDPNWTQYLGSVYCIANDREGQFQVPNNTITSWADGNMMNVQVGRMRTVHNILPHDASGVVFPALNWKGGFIQQRQ